MNNVYEVRYEALVVDLPVKYGTWDRTNGERIHVLANGSAESAIRKAKAHLLKKRVTWRDEHGDKRVTFNRKVRITSCERILHDVVK